ncbi:MAG: hypothetical protein QME74_11735 [Candidatus Edwardsbacteria bacterium]|nr:hypothetical protein [Candidatus Edwardsbacteria bacterium]
MRIHQALPLLLLAVSVITAPAPAQQSVVSDSRYLDYYPKSVQETINLNDSTSGNIIDRLNDYSYQSYIISKYKDIEDHTADRIHMEVHLGTGFLHSFRANTPYRDSGYIFLGFKVNLMNPKIPQPAFLVNKVHIIKNHLACRNFAFSEEMLKRAQRIEDDALAYQRQFWWKRISLGVSIPVYAMDFYENPKWYRKRTAIFIGYDIGDLATVQAGASVDRAAYLAVRRRQ